MIKNNIPFIATIHYGQSTIFYEKDAKEIIEAQNYGMVLEMYGLKALEDEEIGSFNVPHSKIPITGYVGKENE